MVHVDVSEGDVVDYAAADGPDGRTDPAHVNSLEQHVLGGGTIIVLNGNAVVLCQNELVKTSGFAKKVCPRLRYSACWRSGEITQPRTHCFGQLCKSSETADRNLNRSV